MTSVFSWQNSISLCPASWEITSWEIDGETAETVTDVIFGEAPKPLQVVTAAMTLKDACSLEEKL